MGCATGEGSRCTVEDNDQFIDMMEKYFEIPLEFKRLQGRPNFHYQRITEIAGVVLSLDPKLIQGDWNEPGAHTNYSTKSMREEGGYERMPQELNAKPVIPEGFPEWKETMDSWGYKLISAIEDLVLRLDVYKKLDKHRGCVNTVSFNLDGDILVSGSDDRRVILWDWQTRNVKLLFHSGHSMMCSKQRSCHTLMIAVLLPLLQMDRFAMLKFCNVAECRLNC